MTGADLSTYDLDGPFPREVIDDSGERGIGSRFQVVLDIIDRERPTIRQLLHRLAGARGHRVVVGTPEYVADEMQLWHESEAADGFNVMPPWLTGGFDVFVEEVVPILRKRGLLRFRVHRVHPARPLRAGSAGQPVPPPAATRRRPHDLPQSRDHRRQGQPADPGRDDVRRLGKHRPRRVRPYHPPGPRLRHQRRRHRRRLCAGRVGGDRREGAQGPPRRRGPCHQVPRRDVRRRPQPRRQLAALDRARGRELAAAAADRPHRPLPGAPAPAGGRHRRHALGAVGPGAPGQGPLHRYVDVPAVAGRRGPVGRRAPPSRATGDRAAAVLDPGPRGRARHLPDGPAPRPRHPAVEPAGRRVALRALPPRRGAARLEPPAASAGPPRSLQAGERRQAGGRSRPPGPGRRGGTVADPPRAGIRPRAPCGLVGHHRPADHGAAGVRSWAWRRSRWRRTCWTGSTRSSRRARRSTRPTGAMRHPRWSSLRCGEAESARRRPPGSPPRASA